MRYKKSPISMDARALSALLFTNQLSNEVRIAIYSPDSNVIGLGTTQTIGSVDSLLEPNPKKIYQIYSPIIVGEQE